MTWSFQLYSARNFQPWEDVLATLADVGYRNVEGFGAVFADPKGFRAELDRHDLAMPTAHFSLEMLENDFSAAREIARALGVTLIACPFLPPEQRPGDAAGWTAFGKRLAKVGEAARWAGFDFAWHNHDFEFQRLPDGSIPQALIFDAAPEVGWEIDVAWVVRGGADVDQWVKDYADRIVAVHVKDIAPHGEAADEDGWADVGHGIIDWRGLLETLRARTPARHFIMEHDRPSDYARFARRSLEAVQSW